MYMLMFSVPYPEWLVTTDLVVSWVIAFLWTAGLLLGAPEFIGGLEPGRRGDRPKLLWYFAAIPIGTAVFLLFGILSLFIFVLSLGTLVLIWTSVYENKANIARWVKGRLRAWVNLNRRFFGVLLEREI